MNNTDAFRHLREIAANPFTDETTRCSITVLLFEFNRTADCYQLASKRLERERTRSAAVLAPIRELLTQTLKESSFRKNWLAIAIDNMRAGRRSYVCEDVNE